MNVEQKIENLLIEKFEDPEFSDCYIVDIEHPASNRLEIYLDSDTGITFEKCRRLSRYLEAYIDEEGWMGEKYILEVSSPGLTRPLKLWRQYPKNVGRDVKVKTTEGEEVKGKLTAVTKENITVEYQVVTKVGKKKKKREMVAQVIPFENIEETKIKISFK